MGDGAEDLGHVLLRRKESFVPGWADDIEARPGAGLCQERVSINA